MRQSCLKCNLAIQGHLRKGTLELRHGERAYAFSGTRPAPGPSHPGLAHPSQRRASRPTAGSASPQVAPPRPPAALPPLSPFSKKLITARVPVAAAKPASAEAAEAPAGERAAEGEGEPLSELRLGRFLFFLDDMICRQPGS